MKEMKLQILQDNDAGIFIPIKDWENLKGNSEVKKHLSLNFFKNILLNELKESLYELKLIEEVKSCG